MIFTPLFLWLLISKPLPQLEKDVASPGAIVTALYEVISGPAGQKRDWNRMRNLFGTGAKLAAIVKRSGGELVRVEMTVDDYISRSGPYLEGNGFFEKEIARRTELFGSMCQIWTTYESRKKLDDRVPFERGINGLQLWNNGKRWWIQSLLWQGEDGDLKLPPKYLKGEAGNR